MGVFEIFEKEARAATQTLNRRHEKHSNDATENHPHRQAPPLLTSPQQLLLAL